MAEGMERRDNIHAQFTTDMCRYYEAVKPDDPFMNKNLRRPFQYQQIWCPVLHQYFEYSDIKAAHIVPRSIGSVSMRLIFGKKKHYESKSVENGLLLSVNMAGVVDDESMSIVPNTDADGEADFRIRN